MTKSSQNLVMKTKHMRVNPIPDTDAINSRINVDLGLSDIPENNRATVLEIPAMRDMV